jgi:hypothetical protein
VVVAVAVAVMVVVVGGHAGGGRGVCGRGHQSVTSHAALGQSSKCDGVDLSAQQNNVWRARSVITNEDKLLASLNS